MKIIFVVSLLCAYTTLSNAQSIVFSESAESYPKTVSCCALVGYGLSIPDDSRRSAGLAVLLEWFVPTVGHAYAGNWKRGLLPNAVRVSGGVLLSSALLHGDLSTGTFEAGVIMMAAGTVWAMARAGKTARAYNERRGLSMDVGVRHEGVLVGVAYVF